MKLHFELVTPERVVFRQEVDEVSLPTSQGEITVLPHHAPLVAKLVAGLAQFKKGQERELVAVSGGFIEIANNTVRVMADTAERAEELDVNVIEEAKKRAEQVMRENVHKDDESYAMAAAALERELARFRVVQKHRRDRRTPTIDAANLPHDENPA
jgi:F-type H+-transporting ATPase subunit epsilon